MTATRARAALVAVALVTALVAVSGCGGGSDDAAFRHRANAICADGNRAIDELAKDFGPKGPTATQLAEVAPKVPRLMNGELDRLATLQPPADLADEYARMLAEFRRVVVTMEQPGTAFFDHARDHFAQAYALARKLGLDTCAE